MNFLNPALWAGIFLATLPIIIHLLARRRLKRQPFPTLEFLRRLQTQRMRKIKIRQILLLVLRTLAILFLVLAFLRPAISNLQASGSQRRDTVIIFDLSASMSARRATGMPIVNARDTLEEIIKNSSNKSRTALVFTGSSETDDIDWFVPDGSESSWINNLISDGQAGNFKKSWSRAAGLLHESASDDKELIIISDFCDPAPDTVEDIPPGVNVFLLPAIQNNDGMPGNSYNENYDIYSPNITVKDMEAEVLSFQDESTINLSPTLLGFGLTEALPGIASINLDGRRMAESEFIVQPGQPTLLTFTINTAKKGQIAGELEIETNDILSIDNRYPFILDLPGQLNVLVTGNDEQMKQYISLALDPKEKNRGKYSVDVNFGRLQNVDLSKYDAIIVAGAKSLNSNEILLAKQFCEGNKGLWILLSSQSDIPSYNRGILKEFGYEPVAEYADQGISENVWHEIDNSHPGLSSLLEGNENYNRPRVLRNFKIYENHKDRTIIRLSDGSPFLIEHTIDSGRIWLSTSPADTQWTDWPISGIFAPLLQGGVTYLATGEGHSRAVTDCGDPIFWNMNARDNSELRETVDPMGSNIPAIPVYHLNARQWRTDATYWPGHYRLNQNDQTVDLAAARVPLVESNLDFSTESLSQWPGEILSLGQNQTVSSALEEKRHGHEISIWLLISAFLLLIAEMLLAKEWRKNEPQAITV